MKWIDYSIIVDGKEIAIVRAVGKTHVRYRIENDKEPRVKNIIAGREYSIERDKT